MFLAFSVGLFPAGKLMPSKWRCEFTALIYFRSFTLWVLWCCPKAAVVVLLFSHFHSAAVGIKQDTTTRERVAFMSLVPPKVSLSEPCITVRNKQGTWRCLSLQCFFLTRVPLPPLLILFSFTGNDIASLSDFDQLSQWKAFILFQAML